MNDFAHWLEAVDAVLLAPSPRRFVGFEFSFCSGKPTRVTKRYSDGTSTRVTLESFLGPDQSPKYPHKPGEPIMLTDEQIREWRRAER